MLFGTIGASFSPGYERCWRSSDNAGFSTRETCRLAGTIGAVPEAGRHGAPGLCTEGSSEPTGLPAPGSSAARPVVPAGTGSDRDWAVDVIPGAGYRRLLLARAGICERTGHRWRSAAAVSPPRSRSRTGLRERIAGGNGRPTRRSQYRSCLARRADPGGLVELGRHDRITGRRVAFETGIHRPIEGRRTAPKHAAPSSQSWSAITAAASSHALCVAGERASKSIVPPSTRESS